MAAGFINKTIPFPKSYQRIAERIIHTHLLDIFIEHSTVHGMCLHKFNAKQIQQSSLGHPSFRLLHNRDKHRLSRDLSLRSDGWALGWMKERHIRNNYNTFLLVSSSWRSKKAPIGLPLVGRLFSCIHTSFLVCATLFPVILPCLKLGDCSFKLCLYELEQYKQQAVESTKSTCTRFRKTWGFTSSI